MPDSSTFTPAENNRESLPQSTLDRKPTEEMTDNRVISQSRRGESSGHDTIQKMVSDRVAQDEPTRVNLEQIHKKAPASYERTKMLDKKKFIEEQLDTNIRGEIQNKSPAPSVDKQYEFRSETEEFKNLIDNIKAQSYSNLNE